VHANNKNKLNNTKKSVKLLFILNSESGKNWLGHYIKGGYPIILNAEPIITKADAIILNADAIILNID
jgi:hypothetical protein